MIFKIGERVQMGDKLYLSDDAQYLFKIRNEHREIFAIANKDYLKDAKVVVYDKGALTQAYVE